MNKALENRIDEPARWSLRLIGGFELSVLPGGERVASPGKRERALLAYLALSPKGRQPRRKLAALIWGDATDQTLLDNLRTCVWRLRKALGDTEHRLIASDDEDIVLDTAAFDVDALAFRRLAVQSGRSELETAADLCGGELLEGLDLDSEEFESWRRAEAICFRDQAVDVLSRLMTLLHACAETERALEVGARILRLEPLHETTARHMMKLYAESGRRGTAIQVYRTLAEALRRDVNTQPETKTRLVFAEIAHAGDDQAIGPATEDAMPSSRPTSVEHASDTPAGSPPLVWPAFGLRAPLAVLAAALIVTIALVSFWWLAPGPVAGTPDTRQPGIAVNSTAPIVQTAALTVAVLPFDNLSGDAGQQFFSDGMTEEITAALAKVPGLQVIARASAFQFSDDEKKDTRRVGQALGARYVINGSVRKAGNRVRITAQLIRMNSGVSVWSDSYDRELTDVFAVQEDIATAIAGALRMSLGLAPEEHLVSSRSVDPESYQQFLRARQLVRARSTGVPQAITILEPVVARNPDYAPAWALLASSYSTMPGYVDGLERRRRIDEFWPKAEAAAHRAIQLDPNLADAYFALGRLQRARGKLVEADDLLSKALALDPNNAEALGVSIELLSNVGRLKAALAVTQQLRTLEPYVPTFNEDAAVIFWENGQNDTAIKIRKSLMERPTGPPALAMMYASMGRYTEAADVLETAVTGSNLPQYIAIQREQLRTAAAVLRTAPAKAVLPQGLPRVGRLSWIYLYVGAPERTLDIYEDMIKSGLVGGVGGSFSLLWHPSYAPVRKTERFKTIMRQAGFVDYWRARGWPDLCRPVGTDDFLCE